jgi:hypothetical protein
MDNHVPPEGRDLIRKTLHEAGVTFSFYENASAQRKSSPLSLSIEHHGYVLWAGIWLTFSRCFHPR